MGILNYTLYNKLIVQNLVENPHKGQMKRVLEMANPLLESFGEPLRIRLTNSSCPPTDLKGKGNPDLFKLLASYQFVFQPFGTFDLSAMQVYNPPRDPPSP